MDIEIRNSQECFVALWRELERTRQRFGVEYRRFCIRRVMREWFGAEATDDYIWDVCYMVSDHVDDPVYGLTELPLPSLYPLVHREFLRALVAVKLGLTPCKVKLQALDAAYSIAFPRSTAIHTDKKKKSP